MTSSMSFELILLSERIAFSRQRLHFSSKCKKRKAAVSVKSLRVQYCSVQDWKNRILTHGRVNYAGRLCGVYKSSTLRVFGVSRLVSITLECCSYEYTFLEVVCCTLLLLVTKFTLIVTEIKSFLRYRKIPRIVDHQKQTGTMMIEVELVVQQATGHLQKARVQTFVYCPSGRWKRTVVSVQV